MEDGACVSVETRLLHTLYRISGSIDTFLMYDLYLILLFNIHFMFKQSCSKGCILIIDSIVESTVAPGIHNIWVGTVLQQDGGTFFFLTLHSLLELHQETDHSFKELRINILQDSLSGFFETDTESFPLQAF